MEVKSNVGEVAKDTKKLTDESKKAQKGVSGIGTAFKGIGTAIKAAGIGLVVGLLAKLMEVFSKNQTVLDNFNTAMTALEIAFNDLFTFLSNNIGTIKDFFKDIFENPKQSIIDFGDAIKDNLIERFMSLLDVFGFLGKALKELMDGEFGNAIAAVKEAGVEMADVFTGVDGTVDKVKETIKETTTAIIDYTKSTTDQAAAITAAAKAAIFADAEFQKLNAQFLKDAELQRQIRDDETKTFAQRIEANNKLKETLEEQQKLQREQVQIAITAAQAQVDLNASDENKLALMEAQNVERELEETITGQLSEQKTNAVSLDKELLETQRELRAEGLSGLERELQDLQDAYDLKLEMARKSGEDTTAITKQFEKQKTEVVQANLNEQLSAFSGLAGALSSLAGDNKALAVASAVIDTYVGANKAFAQGGVAGFATGAAVIAAGLANVRNIMQTEVKGAGGGASASIPNASPIGNTIGQAIPVNANLNDLVNQGNDTPPVQAYVISQEVTDSQEADLYIKTQTVL